MNNRKIMTEILKFIYVMIVCIFLFFVASGISTGRTWPCDVDKHCLPYFCLPYKAICTNRQCICYKVEN
ncbi:unnamed protein product [Trifolium pratense]|uniref:Uncharacterized protein n=1 Tax=Trifolium pratense TaxID=57577 RepID=A0ACB0LJJ1_TRIPR|nr:unnamed protein product [Trifolium pratense]